MAGSSDRETRADEVLADDGVSLTLRPDATGVRPEDVAGSTMKPVQFYSPYGYQARVGLIVPSTNTIIEPEFYRVAPKGVSIHTARILLLGKATPDSYYQMEADTARAARELATAEVDVTAWGCTSGSVICPASRIEKTITDATGTAAVSTISAVLAALAFFGVKKVALGTPYVTFVNDSEVHFLRDNGFEVVSAYGMQLGETQEERRGIGRVPPESLLRYARFIDHPDAEALFFSCTNLATIEMIAAIEDEIGKPVVTSNQATFWRTLRTAGIRQRIDGFGRLLAEA